LTYPGEIKVTVLRESRFTELARLAVRKKTRQRRSETQRHRDTERKTKEDQTKRSRLLNADSSCALRRVRTKNFLSLVFSVALCLCVLIVFLPR